MTLTYPTVSPEHTAGAKKLLAIASNETAGVEWLGALEEADVRALIGAIGGLSAQGGITGARREAQREAARAMVELKLTEQMVHRMQQLERANEHMIDRVGRAERATTRMAESSERVERLTARLEKVGIWVGVAGLALAGAQVWHSGPARRTAHTSA